MEKPNSKKNKLFLNLEQELSFTQFPAPLYQCSLLQIPKFKLIGKGPKEWFFRIYDEMMLLSKVKKKE